MSSGDVWPHKVHESPEIMRDRWSEHSHGYRRSGLATQEEYLQNIRANSRAENPLTIGWVGSEPHLIDGHHRYMLASRNQTALLPVEHQEGLG